ncbi:hypothetical protein OAP63_02920 [Vibrio sp.]|nr:hypothetical protein [Vibrio sp.]
MINFKLLSISTSLIALTLCAVLLLVPEVLFWLFSVEANSSALFMGRRAAMLFLGLSVLSWSMRNVGHSKSRQAVCLCFSVSMFGLVTLGTVEYFRGFAGAGISLAIVTETILAALYLKVWIDGRHCAKA